MPPDRLAAHGEGIEVESDMIADLNWRFRHGLWLPRREPSACASDWSEESGGSDRGIPGEWRRDGIARRLP
jgi:hypothetical protein